MYAACPAGKPADEKDQSDSDAQDQQSQLDTQDQRIEQNQVDQQGQDNERSAMLQAASTIARSPAKHGEDRQ